MNKTHIEWCRNPDGSQGYTWNPITGCLNHDNGLCKGGGFPCYAYKLANGRLKQRYLANKNIAMALTGMDLVEAHKPHCDPFYPRFWEERLWTMGIDHMHNASQRPKGIFVCDMGDLFGMGVPEEWTRRVLSVVRDCSEHRFYLLTKQPQNLPRWSPFPENCWVGVTATNGEMFQRAGIYLDRIEARIKYISFEPLLERIDFFGLPIQGLDWLIPGACTGTLPEMVRLCDRYPPETLAIMRYGNKLTAQPRIEWVQEIVAAADRAGIKVFLKDNHKPLLENEPLNPLYWANVCNDDRGNERVDDSLRQEMPEGGQL